MRAHELGRRVLWPAAMVAVMVASLGAEEPATEPATTDSSPAGATARGESTLAEGDSSAPDAGQAGGRADEPQATAPDPASEPETGQAVQPPAPVISASATTGPDAGAAVMLRCLGADGVFTFGAGSDDFVAWALSPGPIDLMQPFGLHYRFGVVPPVGEQCRIFREPFPPGVVPPASPPPPSP